MRSLLIEFHRFKDLDTGILRQGDDYLRVVAAHPVREFEMPLDHREFLGLMRHLRYESKAEDRADALKHIAAHVTRILGTEQLSDLQTGEFPLQLDLVVNAHELAALPFEAVTDPEGQPLLAQQDRPIELTRRVRRRDFAETSIRWPARPRILFIWASPPEVNKVPYQEHEAALRAALEPWMPPEVGADKAPDSGKVLTTLREASLSEIEKTCRAAVEKKAPFTHVHFLAHGYPVGPKEERRFGMALQTETGELCAVTPEALNDALAPLRGSTAVVTLATCDAANATNTIVPEQSIAYELHVSGFPVVIASQLPFTVDGSNLFVEQFYHHLLGGKDVRIALHHARLALYENRASTFNDWVSLVGYATLPEGYAEHLLEVRLDGVLESLRTVRDYSDELVKSDEGDAAPFDRAARLLQGRIEELKGFLNDTENLAVLQENRGLLGSAEKRLAELQFARGQRDPVGYKPEEMRAALKRSRHSYRLGCDANLSHHWTAVQYLSLEAALDGAISEPGRWHAAVVAAETARKKPDEYWAQGSLAELYLLAPFAGQAPSLDRATKRLVEMKERVKDHASDRFPLESTEVQLRRYVDWWTTRNGFFPGKSDLAADATRLLEVLTG